MFRFVTERVKKYKFLFKELVKRDLKAKYKNTILGVIWSIISPLFRLAVMSFIFGYALSARGPYFIIYIFAGEIVYNFFSESTSTGMHTLMNNANIFSSINVPKYIFLLSKMVVSVVNFLLSFAIFLVFIPFNKLPFTWKYLLLIYPMICETIFNLGVGMIVSAMFIFFKDMSHLYSIITSTLMFFSAVFYPITRFPAHLQRVFMFNPIYIYIKYFRDIVIDSKIPSLQIHALALGYALLFFVIGILVYKKFNYKFLYYI